MRQAFINYIQSERRYSGHTLKSYNIDLIQFEDFLSARFGVINADQATHQMVRSWLIKLLDNGILPRTVNRKISCLKSFYKFLLSENKIVSNPMDKVISPKTSKILPEFVKEKDLDKLIHEIPFECSFEGIRTSELIGMKVEDVDMSRMQIKVLGKRNKERFVPLPELLKETIQRYLIKRSEINPDQAAENPFLFITKQGKQTYQKLVYRIINKYLAYVSTNSKKSPHTLRHSFATIMLNNGAELNSIKEILGHTNLSGTQVYTHNSIEKLKAIYKQAHPRA